MLHKMQKVLLVMEDYEWDNYWEPNVPKATIKDRENH